jgi:hypothetical protein
MAFGGAFGLAFGSSPATVRTADSIAPSAQIGSPTGITTRQAGGAQTTSRLGLPHIVDFSWSPQTTPSLALYADALYEFAETYYRGDDWSERSVFSLSLQFIQTRWDPSYPEYPAAGYALWQIRNVLTLHLGHEGSVTLQMSLAPAGVDRFATAIADPEVLFDRPNSLFVAVDIASRVRMWLNGEPLTVTYTPVPSGRFRAFEIEQEFPTYHLDVVYGGLGGYGGARYYRRVTRWAAVWFSEGDQADAILAIEDPLGTTMGTPQHYYALDGDFADTGATPYGWLDSTGYDGPGPVLPIRFVEWAASAASAPCTFDTEACRAGSSPVYVVKIFANEVEPFVDGDNLHLFATHPGFGVPASVADVGAYSQGYDIVTRDQTSDARTIVFRHDGAFRALMRSTRLFGCRVEVWLGFARLLEGRSPSLARDAFVLMGSYRVSDIAIAEEGITLHTSTSPAAAASDLMVREDDVDPETGFYFAENRHPYQVLRYLYRRLGVAIDESSFEPSNDVAAGHFVFSWTPLRPTARDDADVEPDSVATDEDDGTPLINPAIRRVAYHQFPPYDGMRITDTEYDPNAPWRTVSAKVLIAEIKRTYGLFSWTRPDGLLAIVRYQADRPAMATWTSKNIMSIRQTKTFSFYTAGSLEIDSHAELIDNASKPSIATSLAADGSTVHIASSGLHGVAMVDDWDRNVAESQTRSVRSEQLGKLTDLAISTGADVPVTLAALSGFSGSLHDRVELRYLTTSRPGLPREYNHLGYGPMLGVGTQPWWARLSQGRKAYAIVLGQRADTVNSFSPCVTSPDDRTDPEIIEIDEMGFWENGIPYYNNSYSNPSWKFLASRQPYALIAGEVPVIDTPSIFARSFGDGVWTSSVVAAKPFRLYPAAARLHISGRAQFGTTMPTVAWCEPVYLWDITAQIYVAREYASRLGAGVAELEVRTGLCEWRIQPGDVVRIDDELPCVAGMLNEATYWEVTAKNENALGDDPSITWTLLYVRSE